MTLDGETPIHHAIIVGNAKMLELLVSADPKALSHTNVMATEPPLITACKLQKAAPVKVLLNRKAWPGQWSRYLAAVVPICEYTGYLGLP